jgi:uncharacterized membrane protein
MRHKLWGRLLRYFLQGFLLIGPIVITIYVISGLFKWVDGMVPNLFNIQLYPGVGIIIILTFIVILGYVASNFLTRSLVSILENYIKRIPLINLLYSSTKDVMDAFVGDKKKFDHPVLVMTKEKSDTYRIGFVTREDVSKIGLPDHVAVYFPHSYNISGNVYIIPSSRVKHLDISSSDAMKFVVSGGVTGLTD